MRPNKLYLIGAGRHTATRQLRRTSRVLRRVIRVGELTICHRRIDVDATFVEKHIKVIIAHMRKGTLIVAHSGDSFVDEAELLAMFDTPAEAGIFVGEVEAPAETEAEDLDLSDEEKVSILTDMGDLPDAAKEEIAEFGGYTPSDAEIAELHDEPETATEAVPELVPTGTVSKTAKELPDVGSLTKKQLIALCEELGIEVKGSPNNATLHDMLNEWKNS